MRSGRGCSTCSTGPLAAEDRLQQDVDEEGLDPGGGDATKRGPLVVLAAPQCPEQGEDDPDQAEVAERGGGVEDPIGSGDLSDAIGEVFGGAVEAVDELVGYAPSEASGASRRPASPAGSSSCASTTAPNAGHMSWYEQLLQSGDGLGRKSPESHARSIAPQTALRAQVQAAKRLVGRRLDDDDLVAEVHQAHLARPDAEEALAQEGVEVDAEHPRSRAVRPWAAPGLVVDDREAAIAQAVEAVDDAAELDAVDVHAEVEFEADRRDGARVLEREVLGDRGCCSRFETSASPLRSARDRRARRTRRASVQASSKSSIARS